MIDIKKILEYSYNLRVLYVEDDEECRNDTLDVFKHFFKDIDVAADGKEALQLYHKYYNYAKRYYDIVITDMVMPQKNGLELTKDIYNMNPKQTIIVISAYSDPKDLIDFINLGIDYFLTKPFDLNSVYKLIYRISKKISNQYIIQLMNHYTWNKETSTLYYNKKEIKLTKKEKKLLEVLISTKSVVSTETILHKVWGDKLLEYNTDVLKPLVSRLKKKLPLSLIENVYALGYKIKR